MTADVRQLRPELSPAAAPFASRVRLRKLARLDVEQARAFVMSLDGATAGADLPRAMYLLGLLEAHARNLLDAIDAATVPGGET